VSSELEQTGAFVTAGLVATEIEGTTLSASGGEVRGDACANCGSLLTGPFCRACGQAAHLHRSLLHLIEELLHNVLHFDAKGWRTLPLLAGRPGLLTRRYIDGQRTRYLSPLGLFLFTGFLMFFVVSLTVERLHTYPADPASRAAAHEGLAAEVEQARKEVERATTTLDAARRAGRSTAAEQEALSDAQKELGMAETTQRWAESAMSFGNVSAESGSPAGAVAGAGGEAGSVARVLADWSDKKLDTGSPRTDALIRHALHNPELYLYRLENTAYKFLFMLIPISLPFLWLMFVGRRDVAVYDHAVFSLYSLSFMSLLIVVCALLGLVGVSELAVTLLLVVPPLHMFLQLRETYRLGLFGSLWRTVMLLAIAGTAFLLFVVFILLMSLR
jgi:Protein of unknown function (DUF3667)